jgi:hypothetical protein
MPSSDFVVSETTDPKLLHRQCQNSTCLCRQTQHSAAVRIVDTHCSPLAMHVADAVVEIHHVACQPQPFQPTLRFHWAQASVCPMCWLFGQSLVVGADEIALKATLWDSPQHKNQKKLAGSRWVGLPKERIVHMDIDRRRVDILL